MNRKMNRRANEERTKFGRARHTETEVEAEEQLRNGQLEIGGNPQHRKNSGIA